MLSVLHSGAICAVLAAGGPLLADEASHRAAAERLLGLTGVEQQVNLAYNNLRSSMLENFDNSGAPPEARPVFEKYVDNLMGLLSKALSWESAKGDYVDVFVREFTREEIDKLLEFYSTPLGKKTVTVLPELYKKGAEIGQKRYESIKPEIDKLTDAMMDEVSAIQRKHQNHKHE